MVKKICFIGADPNFLGGIPLYIKHLIETAPKKEKLAITVVYEGNKDSSFIKNQVRYVKLSSSPTSFLGKKLYDSSFSTLFKLKTYLFNNKVRAFLQKESFDVVNSHAIWGSWMTACSKNSSQRWIHTYHGSTYFYLLAHLPRFSFLKKLLLRLALRSYYSLEKPPMEKADRIISVSPHVNGEMITLYGPRKNMCVLRTGTKISKTKKIDKKKNKRALGLSESAVVGLYVGRGGYWTKGLDRAITLSKNIHAINPNYKLFVVGADEQKTSAFLKEPFVENLGVLDRKEIMHYFLAADVFFGLSRYEGGDPTLAVGEAMASRCLVVCSHDARQEILKEGGGIVIDAFGQKEAHYILDILGDSKRLRPIIRKAQTLLGGLSLASWGKQYWELLLNHGNYNTV